MCDKVEPFSVPAQESRPHFVFLVGKDFFFEKAADSAERDHVGAFCALCSTRCTCFRLENGIAHDGGEEGAAGYVHVAEVGAVGFVQVVVSFEKRGAARGYDGLEEGVGRDRGRLQVELIDEGAKDADLDVWLVC